MKLELALQTDTSKENFICFYKKSRISTVFSLFPIRDYIFLFFVSDISSLSEIFLGSADP